MVAIRTLPTSFNLPKIGLGTLGISPSEARSTINESLSLGYRCFDAAPVYFNEKDIGDAFHESTSPVPRTDVFITSKLACPFHKPQHVEPALRKTLLDLRIGYLDLFLIHWPVAFNYVNFDPTMRGWPNEDIDESNGGSNIDPTVSLRDTWEAMESLVDKGLVKYIGVANFPVILLHDLLSYSRIPPVVNQVEIHPYNQQSKLLAYCKSRNVTVQAYSPLGMPSYKESGEPDILSDPVLTEIADAHGITVAQVCLQWSLQRDTHVIVKSSNKKHLEENLMVGYKNEFANSGIQLTSEEMERIASLDRSFRFTRPEDWWKDMAVFS
ncbi:aldo-keto oxidoreductase [Thalassiosira pseudonana CCMP1335]|uniref:Aldo-keto oxidoreductase n=1 Tax=Thalassiosira pseudonana TaxID=35128 RepID=B8BYP0_THAPS|nr:aldo-keto oxidoreductase [Thalassiosira pseudonana CCMP1335]EED93922.1 aldo-keto oxidoreductase [Thalassiosira pseudonana CCMP1335]|eukprot:g2826.t1 g2826   contig12:871487-872714(-)